MSIASGCGLNTSEQMGGFVGGDMGGSVNSFTYFDAPSARSLSMQLLGLLGPSDNLRTSAAAHHLRSRPALLRDPGKLTDVCCGVLRWHPAVCHAVKAPPRIRAYHADDGDEILGNGDEKHAAPHATASVVSGQQVTLFGDFYVDAKSFE